MSIEVGAPCRPSRPSHTDRSSTLSPRKTPTCGSPLFSWNVNKRIAFLYRSTLGGSMLRPCQPCDTNRAQHAAPLQTQNPKSQSPTYLFDGGKVLQGRCVPQLVAQEPGFDYAPHDFGVARLGDLFHEEHLLRGQALA